MKPYAPIKYVLPVFIVIAIGLGIAYYSISPSSESAAPPHPTAPDAALDELRSGNLRFVNSHRTQSTDTKHDAEDRRHTAKGQHPFSAVLCCSDSRVTPEFIFDQRIGAIFEVRNAGNVVDDDVMASLEYAVEHLHVPLIVILGHKGCGAIEAVCEAGEEPLHDHLRALQIHMQGIHKEVIEHQHHHDILFIDHLAQENAKQQALVLLRESEPLKAVVDQGKVRLMHGIHDMQTGKVEFFDLPR